MLNRIKSLILIMQFFTFTLYAGCEKTEEQISSETLLIDLRTLFAVEGIERQSLIKIPVLDQTQARYGEQSCGYHAWKNALLLLDIAHSSDNLSLLKDSKFFNRTVCDYLVAFIPQKQKLQSDYDIDISALISATASLMTDHCPEKLNFLKPYTSEISIVNYFDPADYDALLCRGAGSMSLIEIEKTYRALTSTKPMTHAFLVGGEGHWVTLVMQKREEGVFWFGCDSWPGNPVDKQLEPIKNYFVFLMENPAYLKNVLKQAYPELVPSLVTLAFFLELDGTPIAEEIYEKLNSPEKIAAMLLEIEHGVKFFTDSCLLEDALFDEYTEGLRKILNFCCVYLQNVEDPQLQVYLDRLHELRIKMIDGH